jgi:hypothetical protein
MIVETAKIFFFFFMAKSQYGSKVFSFPFFIDEEQKRLILFLILQGSYWRIQRCCCNDWTLNTSSAWSAELGGLFE